MSGTVLQKVATEPVEKYQIKTGPDQSDRRWTATMRRGTPSMKGNRPRKVSRHKKGFIADDTRSIGRQLEF